MKVIEISKNQNPELKRKYVSEMFKTLYNAYNIHGAGDVFMVLSEKNPYGSLLQDKYIWELALDDNDKILACILYKGDDTLGKEDRKYSLMAARMSKDPDQPASKEAKEALYHLIENDINCEERRAWGEISGAIEHIYIDKKNGHAISSNDAELIMAFNNKRVVPTADGKHFLRRIGQGEHAKDMEKVLVGSIPLETAQKLKTYKEVELAIDCSKLDFETKKEITINLLIVRDFENSQSAKDFISTLDEKIKPYVNAIYENDLKEKEKTEKENDIKIEFFNTKNDVVENKNEIIEKIDRSE